MEPCRRPVVDRRTFLVGGTAAGLGALIGLPACASRARPASPDRVDRRTTTSSATARAQAEPRVDRIVTGDQPNGFTVPAGQTWEMRGLVTTPLNVVVLGRLRQRSGATLRFRNVDEQAFVGSSGSHAHATVTESDVGLWVMDGGVVDLVGTPKTGWVRAADAIPAGADALPLESAPSGWQVGDRVVVAPTAAPNTDEWQAWDHAEIRSIEGSVLVLDRPIAHAHPKVDGRWTAEIANLTRDVNIEGTAEGRAHILIHSNQPQTVKHVGIRYMGPRKFTGESDNSGPLQESVLGRYALHFHQCEGHSRGTVVEGAVITETGNKCYVPHTSHGITFRDCVSYDTLEDPYWWDGAPSTVEAGPETHDLVYDHCLAARATWDRDYAGTHLGGFMLGRGDRNVCRNCAAVGITGNVEVRSSGFHWPEGSEGVWVFEDCTGHNNGNGIFVWQVTERQGHDIHRFAGFHNHRYGVYHGAYGNNYKYFDSTLYGNLEGGVLVWAASFENDTTPPTMTPEMAQRWERVVFDAGGLSPFAVTIAGRGIVGTMPELGIHPVTMRDCTFRGYTQAAVEFTFRFHDFGPLAVQYKMENCTWADADQSKDFRCGAGDDLHEGSYIDVTDARHGAIKLQRHDQPGTLEPAWNARVSPL